MAIECMKHQWKNLSSLQNIQAYNTNMHKDISRLTSMHTGYTPHLPLLSIHVHTHAYGILM